MKTKTYSLWGKATDKNGVDHFITIVGRFTDTKENETVPTETTFEDEKGKAHSALLLVDNKFHLRKFTMARSICDPRDTFDFEVGKRIANQRIDKGDVIGTIESRDITMLNEDMCNMLVLNELKHGIEKIDSILPNKEDAATKAEEEFFDKMKGIL